MQRSKRRNWALHLPSRTGSFKWSLASQKCVSPLVLLAWMGLLSFLEGLFFACLLVQEGQVFPPAAKTSSQGALEFLNLENNSL